MRQIIFFLFFLHQLTAIELGVDQFFRLPIASELKTKNIGLIVNQTSVNRSLDLTVSLFLKNGFKVKALFSPEHGFYGLERAGSSVGGSIYQGIPIYSLHGETRRPTKEMLKDLDVLIFDIQDIGVRSYTYVSTLFYAMEEAAKAGKKFIVLDRPNPLGGNLVDGVMLEDSLRSFVGYINVPYCHGMTIGELAKFFQTEYHIQIDLQIVPMKGWKRSMVFADTGLCWIPSSPYIPEGDTPFYYATTGLLGELGLVNIGIGYTQPFKMVGAPWIQAESFAGHLNDQKLPGVKFLAAQYKPFYGQFKEQICQGVLIRITDPKVFKPATTQMLLIGLLKSLYPAQFESVLKKTPKKSKELFCKCSGSNEVYKILEKEKYASWKLMGFHLQEREAFKLKRQNYLIPDYN